MHFMPTNSRICEPKPSERRERKERSCMVAQPGPGSFGMLMVFSGIPAYLTHSIWYPCARCVFLSVRRAVVVFACVHKFLYAPYVSDHRERERESRWQLRCRYHGVISSLVGGIVALGSRSHSSYLRVVV